MKHIKRGLEDICEVQQNLVIKILWFSVMFMCINYMFYIAPCIFTF